MHSAIKVRQSYFFKDLALKYSTENRDSLLLWRGTDINCGLTSHFLPLDKEGARLDLRRVLRTGIGFGDSVKRGRVDVVAAEPRKIPKNQRHRLVFRERQLRAKIRDCRCDVVWKACRTGNQGWIVITPVALRSNRTHRRPANESIHVSNSNDELHLFC